MALSPAHNRVFISFSGGKDSVASYLVTRLHYPDNMIELVFCDTGNEAPETYEYCRWFNENIHPVTRLVSFIKKRTESGRRYFGQRAISWKHGAQYIKDNYHDVFDEIRERHRSNPDVPPFPGNGIRFCTKTLKINTFQRYVRNIVPLSEREKCLVVIGLRRAESNNRSTTQKFAVDSINNWDLWYPIAGFKLSHVWAIHDKFNIPRNPVYEYRERSNCVGCPFSSRKEIDATIERHGRKIMAEWEQLEGDTGYTWKNNESITEGCTSGFCDM